MDEKKIKELGEKARRHAELRTIEELYVFRHTLGELWRVMMDIQSFSRTRFDDRHYGSIREMNDIANEWVHELERKYGIGDDISMGEIGEVPNDWVQELESKYGIVLKTEDV